MEHLNLFHRDVLTIRSHQWKYYVEPYSGCALQCTYCLYSLLSKLTEISGALRHFVGLRTGFWRP